MFYVCFVSQRIQSCYWCFYANQGKCFNQVEGIIFISALRGYLPGAAEATRTSVFTNENEML